MSITHLTDNATICALASGRGGGIALIRVSGSETLRIVSHFFTTKDVEWRPRHAYYGLWKIHGTIIDEVVVTYYRMPHSYTGEDLVEVSCHASPYIIRTIIEGLIREGCRPADPGEYTLRSYLNGKKDLTEAEAVADIIAAESAVQHRIALQQIQGRLRTELEGLHSALLKFASLMELELDFSEEEVEFANREQLHTLAISIGQRIDQLIASFNQGKSLHDGIPIAIIGEPNTGKSTLLNALLQEERAIVSDIAGTTRDTIEERLIIEGVLFRIIDTAGLRETSDPIERIGIDRTYQKAEKATIILVLLDAVKVLQRGIDSLLAQLEPIKSESKQQIILINKMDLIPDSKDQEQALSLVTSHFLENCIIPLSAKEGLGIKSLQEAMLTTSGALQIGEEDIFITNERHLKALQEAREYLLRVLDALDTGVSADLIVHDLRFVLNALGEITGDTISGEDILHSIFTHFCIGK